MRVRSPCRRSHDAAASVGRVTGTLDPDADERARPVRDGHAGRHRRAGGAALEDERRLLIVGDVRVEDAAGDQRERAPVVGDREPELAEQAEIAFVPRAVVDLPRDRVEVDDGVAEWQARSEAEAAHPDAVVGAGVVDAVAADAVDVVPAPAAVAEQHRADAVGVDGGLDVVAAAGHDVDEAEREAVGRAADVDDADLDAVDLARDVDRGDLNAAQAVRVVDDAGDLDVGGAARDAGDAGGLGISVAPGERADAAELKASGAARDAADAGGLRAGVAAGERDDAAA